MKKPKVTLQSLRKELNTTNEVFKSYQEQVRSYICAVSSWYNRRTLMTIEPANSEGRINGLTIPELIMLVQLNTGTGELTQLESDGKHLTVVAKKIIKTPVELL